MAPDSSIMVGRFMRLPRRTADVWQGGVVRMPMWVDGPDGVPYRPRGAVWVSLETGLANAKVGEPDADDRALASPDRRGPDSRRGPDRRSAVSPRDGAGRRRPLVRPGVLRLSGGLRGAARRSGSGHIHGRPRAMDAVLRPAVGDRAFRSRF